MSATLMVSARSLPLPGIRWGDYPERTAEASRAGLVAHLDHAWNALGMASFARRSAPYRRFANRVMAHASTIRREDDSTRARRLLTLRAGLARDGLDERAALEAFALVALSCEHALGMTPFHTQIAAARVMLDNRLVEMATGEGKTVAVALAAAVAALGGTPVHVITANDYLAERDAAALQGFYRACGLTVAAVTQPMNRDARRAAYDASVAYCTARELVFDYLRDGLAQPRAQTDLGRRAQRLGKGHNAARGTLLRGLCMAIIDEADTVLLDEARMPLVISQAADETDSAPFLADALRLAGSLRQGTDFDLEAGRRVVLSESGAGLANAWQAPPSLYASQRRHREATLCQALAALHIYQRDRDYVVREGQVLIVDDSSGRSAPGRAWSRGLHQLIELKEGLAPSRRYSSVAQITFQRFFRRYLRLAGMSGTLRGAERELAGIYGLGVVRIAPRTPSRRRDLPLALYADRAELWRAVAQRARATHASGRPLLIGSDSVADAEQLSLQLNAAGLPHVVLNARFDQAEAEVVAMAGQAGRITVATSMAGRGTDIRLGPGVAELGGLHVILCQHNGARRIDRQFSGRAARNGEPGSVDTMLALDTTLFVRWLPAWWRQLATHATAPRWFRRLTAALPQWLEEGHQRGERTNLLRLDRQREQELDFCQRTAS